MVQEWSGQSNYSQPAGSPESRDTQEMTSEIGQGHETKADLVMGLKTVHIQLVTL